MKSDMHITLIRHGMTVGNLTHRYIGSTDEPLAPEGIEQLSLRGVNTHVHTVYVTPLQRTKQSASILFPNAHQIIIPDFREMDFGDFEGRNYLEMETDSAYRAWVDSGCLMPCPNGERRADFSKRVCDAFLNVVAQARKNKETTLTFVVHDGTIMALMERFALPHRDYYDYSVKNGAGYHCDLVYDSQREFYLLCKDHAEKHGFPMKQKGSYAP